MFLGKYDRVTIAEELKIPAYIIDGRWYAEIKRTQKSGSNHDWKTILNSIIINQPKNIGMTIMIKDLI